MSNCKISLVMTIAFTWAFFPGTATAQQDATAQRPAELSPLELGNIKNVHRSGNLIFSGQFSPADIDSIKETGIQRVITLRNAGEIDFDEPKTVTDADLSFHRVPFASEDSLTDDVFDKVRNLLRDDSKKTLLHCGSANRVGGVWLTYRVLDQGIDLTTALNEAKKIGLRAPFIEQKALDYIKRKKSTTALKSAQTQADADVTFVKATHNGNERWTFAVAVNHPDVGWQDFADGWDVVLPDGKPVLLSAESKFTRVLAHPHVDQRPFTRSQSNIPIPAGTKTVTVRAHDNVHGFGGKTVTVELDKAKGEKFEVVR